MSGLFFVILLLAAVAIVSAVRSGFFAPQTPETKGQAGERVVKKELSTLSGEEYIVLNDVMLPTKTGTTQIDHIVISLYGIFVIETKNYSGKIYGGENSEQWAQYLGGEKYVFQNPIKQNLGHKQAVAQYTHVDPHDIIPLVVFTGSAWIKVAVGGSVVTTEWLVPEIKRYRERVFSREQIERYAKELDDAIEENEETVRTHIDSVREKVIQRNQEIAFGNCPWCNGHLVLRNGRYGAFYGCSNYPQCRYIKNID